MIMTNRERKSEHVCGIEERDNKTIRRNGKN